PIPGVVAAESGHVRGRGRRESLRISGLGTRMIAANRARWRPSGGRVAMPSREEAIRQDVQDLHGLGYAQQLVRTMGGFSNFAISFSIISILTGAVILYDYGLAWAGKAAVSLGW